MATDQLDRNEQDVKQVLREAEGSAYHDLLANEVKEEAEEEKARAKDEEEEAAEEAREAEANPGGPGGPNGGGPTNGGNFWRGKGDGDDGKKKNFVTRGFGAVRKMATRQWMAAGIIALIIGGVTFALLSIASGPAQVMHAAALGLQSSEKLNNYIMTIHIGKAIQFATTVQNPERRNMGYFGNKLADHYEKKLKEKGITPVYGDDRIKFLNIDTKTDAGKLARQKMLEQGVPESSLVPDGNGKISVDVGATNDLKFRRAAIAGMVSTLGRGKVISAIATRILQVRGGVQWHYKNIVRNKDEAFKDYTKRVQDENAKNYKEGVKTVTADVSSSDDADENKNPGANNEAAEAAGAADDILKEAQDPTKNIGVKTGNIRAKLTAGVGITGLLATVCGVRAIGDAVGELRYSNIVAPLVRQGMDLPIEADAMKQGGDTNPEQHAVTVDAMYDENTKTSWTDAAPVQASLNQKPTGPDLNDAAKPGNDLKPAFFLVIDKIVNAIPGFGGFCDIVGTTAGGWILSAAGVALTATGPVSLILNAATEVAIQLVSAAFIDDLVRWLAGEQVDMNPLGAQWGAAKWYGMRLAANDAAISAGGVALSASQEAEWLLALNTIDQNVNRNKSLYAKYLDIEEPNSLLAKTLFETPAVNTLANDPSYAMSSVAKMPMGMLSSLSNSLGSIFTPKASAAPLPFNYGFPQFGQSLATLEDPGLQNVFKQAAPKVEPRLAELNEKYGTPCFNRTVNPETFVIETAAQMKRYDQIDKRCKDQNDEDLKLYSFYLTSFVAIKAAMCVDKTDVASCSEVGMGVSTAAATNSVVAANKDIDLPHLYDDSTSVSCAEGTKFLQTAEGWHAGKMFKINLCVLPNMKCNSDVCKGAYGVKDAKGYAIVNSRVSGAYFAMANAALNNRKPNGQADPIELRANSSFRTMAKQRSLCPCNGRTVAKPGYSNHQAGTAIDFGDENWNTIDSGDKYFTWLSKNAKDYGIKNYPVESWHWSPTGN